MNNDNEFLSYVNEHLSSILSGQPVDVSEWTQDKKDKFFHICAHCILNGPVGVSKLGSFPLIIGNESSIRSYFNITTSRFRATCLEYAKCIPDEICMKSSYLAVNGNIWPLNMIKN